MTENGSFDAAAASGARLEQQPMQGDRNDRHQTHGSPRATHVLSPNRPVPLWLINDTCRKGVLFPAQA